MSFNNFIKSVIIGISQWCDLGDVTLDDIDGHPGPLTACRLTAPRRSQTHSTDT